MTPFEIGMIVVTLLLLFGLLLGAYRLLSGPTAADRVVALDLCTILGIGLAAVLAIRAENPVLLDVAMVLALVAFLATIALASLIRAEDPGREAPKPPAPSQPQPPAEKSESTPETEKDAPR